MREDSSHKPPGFVISGDSRRKMTTENVGMSTNWSGLSRSEKVLPPPAAPPNTTTSAGDVSAVACGPGWGRIGSGTASLRGGPAGAQRGRLLGVAPDAERPEVLEPARATALGDRHDVVGLPESGRLNRMWAAPPQAHRHLVGETVQKDEDAPQVAERLGPVAARVGREGLDPPKFCSGGGREPRSIEPAERAHAAVSLQHQSARSSGVGAHEVPVHARLRAPRLTPFADGLAAPPALALLPRR